MEKKKKGFIANLTLDTEITLHQAILAYSAITGNCTTGVEEYVARHPEIKNNEKVTLRQILSFSQDASEDKYKKLFEDFVKKHTDADTDTTETTKA